jgi:hypothetical protein
MTHGSFTGKAGFQNRFFFLRSFVEAQEKRKELATMKKKPFVTFVYFFKIEQAK